MVTCGLLHYTGTSCVHCILTKQKQGLPYFYTKIYLINTIWIVVLLEWFWIPNFERISVIAGATCSIRDIYRVCV